MLSNSLTNFDDCSKSRLRISVISYTIAAYIWCWWWSAADELDGGFVDLESGEAFGQPDDDAESNSDEDGEDDDDSESDKGVCWMLQSFATSALTVLVGQQKRRLICKAKLFSSNEMFNRFTEPWELGS